MRVLVLTPYLYGTAPGPRSSIELWERVLKPRGIEFDYVAFETDRLHEIIYERGRWLEKASEMIVSYMRELGLLRRVADYDAVLVYREAALIGPALIERLAARRRPLIYQLDDPLYVPYRSPANGYLSYLKFFGKVRKIARLSRVTVVNSPQHREYVEGVADRIYEIPSVVDEERYFYEPPRRDPGEPITVGWSGSVTTAANLKVIQDVLRRLGDRDDVRLRFIGAASFDLPGVRHEARPWSAETEVADLRTFDIGLLPLPETEWTKRKFYLKLVQYMALGIPAVCTPLGANPSVVDDGVTGFLAEGSADWLEKIERLIDDPALRESVGRSAAAVSQDRYTLAANADRIVEAISAAR